MRYGSGLGARRGLIGGVLAAGLVVGCGGEDEPLWRTHPCPRYVDGEEPPSLLTLDGQIDDWVPEDPVVDDARGDASGAFDVTSLRATTRGDELFIAFEIDRVLNLYNGEPSDGTLLLELTMPDGRRISVDFRGRMATLGSGAVVSWESLGLVAAPSHASDTFEVRLDMTAFEAGHTEEGDVAADAIVEIDFAGSDALDERVIVPLRYGAGERPKQNDARALGTTFRVASFNTMEAGLFHASRSKPIGRLLRAAAADVYALQELGSTTAHEVEAQFASLDPRSDDATWHAVTSSGGSILGNAVVAADPLIPIPLGTNRAVGAVVLRPEGAVAVLSVHLKCCGFQGSEEDRTRLQQVRHITNEITRLRLGQLGAELAPHRAVPIVVVGDFNHVGSPSLLEDLESKRSLALRRWMLPHIGARDVFTWTGYESAFPPAMLDLLLHDGLEQLGGFVLDTRSLSRDHLERLGLWGADALASDHLMLVADFR